MGKIPWRRAWQPRLVFSPGESHGQGSLVGYSPCGHKESDTTEGQTVLGLPCCPEEPGGLLLSMVLQRVRHTRVIEDGAGSSSLPRGFPPVELSSGSFSLHCGAWAPRFDGVSCCGAGLWARGLSICGQRGIFSQQGRNPRPLRWRLDSYPPSHQGNPVAALVPPVSVLILCIESHDVPF